MPITTICEVLTYGDYCTLPGGIALRDRGNDDAGPRYIIQKFNTDRESGTARCYFRTNYAATLAEGLEAFAEDVRAAEHWDAGGSLNTSGAFAHSNPAYPDMAWKGAEVAA